MLTGGRRVSFGGNTVHIQSDEPVMAVAVEQHFRHCPTGRGRPVAHVHIVPSGEGQFAAFVNGRDLFSELSFDTSLQLVIQEAVTQLNGACDTALIFHAAGLAQGGGLLLAAPSGGGKSTLAAWLTAVGWGYLSDEVLAVTLDGAQMSGLPRSIGLKSGSAFVWRRWLREVHQTGFLSLESGGAWIDPALLHPGGVRAEASPQVALFPAYDPTQPETAIERLSPAETLFMLMQSLVNARNFGDHGLAAATALARRVRAFRLTYSDIEDAARQIEGLMG